MKVILSRKGFDSEAGGNASPILPDGRLVSIPIPDNKYDATRLYSELKLDINSSYLSYMDELYSRIKVNKVWQKPPFHSIPCHLDPDLSAHTVERKAGWRGTFGQIDIPQIHLEDLGVSSGDIFLFFGWFKRTLRDDNDKLIFDPIDKEGRHIIFGYLQIGEVIKTHKVESLPEYIKDHPHLYNSRRYDSNNTIYIASERLTFNSSLPGYGVFNNNNNLVLTKDGCTRSKWNLPNFFRNANISHHDQSVWQEDYFQSVKRGQEFVIDADDNIAQWAKNIIESNTINHVI